MSKKARFPRREGSQTRRAAEYTKLGKPTDVQTAKSYISKMVKDDIRLYFSPLTAVAGEFRRQLKKG